MLTSEAEEFMTLLDDYVKTRAEMELDIEFSRQRSWSKKNEEFGLLRQKLLDLFISSK